MLFDKTKKLDKEDLGELREKTKLTNQHIAIAQALQMQKEIWLASLFSKYGLDGNKAWNFNLKTGKIREIKPTKGGEK